MSGKYIVVFKNTVTDDQINEYVNGLKENGGSVTNRYDSSGMKGFAATIPNQYLARLQSLQGDVIDYIEPDGQVTTQ